MKTQGFFLILQVVLASALLWTCFCRLVKTDDKTHREVRWAILLEFIAAGFVLGAPFLPVLMPTEIRWKAWTTPGWVWLLLLTAVTIVQVVTSRFWVEGRAPEPFQRGRAGAFALVVLLAMVGVATVHHPVQAQAGAATPPQQTSEPVIYLPPGASVRCLFAEGCVAMRAMVHVELLGALLQCTAPTETVPPALPPEQKPQGLRL